MARPKYPVRAVLIIPRNFQYLYGDNRSSVNAPLQKVRSVCIDWLHQYQKWLKQQTGYTFRYKFYTLFSKYTHAQIADANGTDMRVLPNGNYGQGLLEDHIWNQCIIEEMGWNSEVVGQTIRRWTTFVIGGGGWAGGRYNVSAGVDEGRCIIGDWDLEYNSLYRQAYGHVLTEGVQNTPSNGGSWSHECLHMFNVHCHAADTCDDGSTLTFTTKPLDFSSDLTLGQKREFINYNYPTYIG